MNVEQKFTLATLAVMIGCHILLFILNKTNYKHKLLNVFISTATAVLTTTITHVLTLSSEIRTTQIILLPVIAVPQIIHGILDSESKVGGGTTKLQNLILGIILSFISLGMWYVLTIL